MGVDHRYHPAAAATPPNAVEARVGNAVLGYFVGRGKAEAAAGAGPRGVKKVGSRFTLAALRLSEVEIVLTDLFSGPVDTDDADFLLAGVAATVAWKLAAEAALSGTGIRTPELTRRVFDHCRRWFPFLSLERVATAAMEMAEARVNLSADEIGRMLGVTWDQRVRLSLRTIGAAGMTTRQRKIAAKKLKRQNDRTRAEKSRRAGGAISRAEYEQQSDSALATRLGVDRKSIGRWRKAGILEQKIAQYECPKSVADTGRGIIILDGHGTSTATTTDVVVGGLTAPTRHSWRQHPDPRGTS